MTGSRPPQDLYALIGYPVSHSLSPLIHNTAFRGLGIPARYVTLPVTPEELPRFASRLPELGLHGFNVTTPHKEKIIDFLDEIDETARAAGAVNTVQLRAGRWIGYNTDVAGFRDSLAGMEPHTDGGVIVLGAGGSARAVCVALNGFAFDRIAVVNRSQARADEIVARMKNRRFFRCTLDTVDFPVRLVINCTTVGFHGERFALPIKIWTQRPLVMDLIYHATTPLLQEARQRGCRHIGGLDMLLRQAALSFQIWTGRPMPMAVIRETLAGK